MQDVKKEDNWFEKRDEPITQEHLLELSRAKSARCKELLAEYGDEFVEKFHSRLLRTMNCDLEAHYHLKYPMYKSSETDYHFAKMYIHLWQPHHDLFAWFMNQYDYKEITEMLHQRRKNKRTDYPAAI